MSHTVRLSNLQYNLLRYFDGKPNMAIEDFGQFDQRVTSSLGRRHEPLIVKASSETVALTLEGKEALRLMNETSVLRNVERLGAPLARCFDRVNRRAAVTQISQRNIHRGAA